MRTFQQLPLWNSNMRETIIDWASSVIWLMVSFWAFSLHSSCQSERLHHSCKMVMKVCVLLEAGDGDSRYLLCLIDGPGFVIKYNCGLIYTLCSYQTTVALINLPSPHIITISPILLPPLLWLIHSLQFNPKPWWREANLSQTKVPINTGSHPGHVCVKINLLLGDIFCYIYSQCRTL